MMKRLPILLAAGMLYTAATQAAPLAAVAVPKFRADTFNIKKYGAVADGLTLNTQSITTAIDACNKKGGGVVLVPQGLWLTGPITLKSNVNLCIQRDAVLLFTTDYTQYPMVASNWEGLPAARNQSPLNATNATNIAVTGKGIVDGNVEMGNYDSAVANADKMVSIRPDLTSYSRISYLREINGNYPAAIEAMKLAVQAGGPGDEYTEWSRVQLAQLFEKTGDYTTADTIYQNSLTFRPNYPFALAGLGRIAVARKDYNRAIQYYQKADSLINDFTIKDELAEAYKLAGQKERGDALQKNVIDEMQQNAKAGGNDEAVGHYADKELAYAYLKMDDKDKALEHALLEYNRRPENIDVNETVAWVYYNRGEFAKAVPYIKTALKTNSKNPVLLSRAALIYYKAGDKPMAKTLLAKTSAANPYIDYALKSETNSILQSL